ncbi:MAG: phosphate ABC transporter substrate-binding protein [Pedosphaera sp.]|nr:phosphate ABC transporter substrate-binding protein [Pedosphaera sp.]
MKISLPKLSLNRGTFTHLRALALVPLCIVLAGCPAGNQTPAPEPGAPSGKLVIRGSNTFGEELAPRLLAAFKKDHPAAAFDTEFKGSAFGMGALTASKCDIAATSRPASKPELDLAAMRGMELKDTVIGAYSVAVIVHSGNGVGNLTKEQVQGIFTGKIQNWKEVGGADAAIHLFARDPISGTHLGFQELAMNKEPYATTPGLLPSYEAIVAAVAKDPSGIGYCGLTEATAAGIKGVAIGGVAPTVASVNKGEYPYARTLHFYVNKAAASKDARAFTDFVLSAAGQKILTDLGFVPKP